MNSSTRLWIVIIFLMACVSPTTSSDLQSSGEKGNMLSEMSYITDTIPIQLRSGDVGQYSITYINTGLETWGENNETIGVLCVSPGSGLMVQPGFSSLPHGTKITPGMLHEFPFSLSADKPGTYSLVFTPSKVVSGQTVPMGISYTIVVDSVGLEKTSTSRETGSIRVMTGNEPVLIFIDGNMIGMTPARSAGLASGLHKMQLSGDGFNQSIDTLVKNGEITNVVFDPFTRQVCLTSVLVSGSSQDDSTTTLDISNIIILIGVFLCLTLIGGYATLSVSNKVKRSFEKADTVLPPQHPVSLSDLSTGIRSSFKKNPDIIFDPVMMSCNEGESGEVKVKVMNSGNRPVIVEGQRVSEGESKFILIRVPAGDPGDQKITRNLVYLDHAGREYGTNVVIRYRVLPNTPQIDWSFSRFVSESSKIIALYTIKNYSHHSIIVADMEIPPDTEGDIELQVTGSNGDAPEIWGEIEIRDNTGILVSIPVLIPWNRGLELMSQKQFHEALEYYDLLFLKDPGSAVLWVQRGQILEDLGRHDESHDSFIQAFMIDPQSEKVQKMLRRFECPNAPMPRSPLDSCLSHFSIALTGMYHPICYVGNDQTGCLFQVEKVEDGSLLMLKIIDTGRISPPSLDKRVKTWKSLHHPHILRLNNWVFDQISYLEMDPPDGVVQKGRTIYSLENLQVPIPSRAAVKICLGIARGVAYLHHQDICHLFLQPSAIFLNKNLHVRIGGFENNITITGEDCSSSCWILAPEQILPERYGNPDKKTDIYQIGVLLYLLLTGSQAYGSNEPHIVDPLDLRSSFPKHVLLPSMFRPDLISFDPIMNRSLAVDKNERYDTIEEMVADLEVLFSSR